VKEDRARPAYIRYRMWDVLDNFGDAINPYVIQHVSGLIPMAGAGRQAHVLGIGSILHRATPESFVWGSGIMFPHMKLPRVEPPRISAVRGELTLEYLRGHGCRLRPMPLGDPGMLLPRVLPRALFAAAERAEIGVVPHHGSMGAPCFAGLMHEYDSAVRVIDFRTRSTDALKQLLSCRVILSQSLHGCVFAEAYGIPYVWISHTDSAEWQFKFRDWLTTTREPLRPASLFDPQQPLQVERLAALARICGHRESGDDLVAAFPSLPPVGNVAPDRKEFEACRSEGRRFVEWALPSDEEAARMVREGLDKAFSQSIRRAVRDAFKSWCEPQYCIVGADRYFDRDDMFARVRRFMNARGKVKFAYLHRAENAPAGESEWRRDAYSGLSVRPSNGRCSPDMVIRPNSDFTLGDPSAASLSV
jgi:hypothetical protein